VAHVSIQGALPICQCSNELRLLHEPQKKPRRGGSSKGGNGGGGGGKAKGGGKSASSDEIEEWLASNKSALRDAIGSDTISVHTLCQRLGQPTFKVNVMYAVIYNAQFEQRLNSLYLRSTEDEVVDANYACLCALLEDDQFADDGPV